MRGDQASGLRARRALTREGPVRPVVGVVSGKGGVGKSVIAVNVALHAASEGARVLLVDGDAGLANADLLLNVSPRRDLDDWVEGRASLAEVVCHASEGLSLVVAGRTSAAAETLERALADRSGGPLADLLSRYDLIVLDLGAGVGDALIALALACARVWLVASPEPTSLADAYTTTKRLWRDRPSLPVELIVNRAPDRRAGSRTHQSLERLVRRFLDRGLPLRGVLLEDDAVVRSVRRQTPVIRSEPHSRIARGLMGLAEGLIGECVVAAPEARRRPLRPAAQDRAGSGAPPGLAG